MPDTSAERERREGEERGRDGERELEERARERG
jgi:hypothetical protein